MSSQSKPTRTDATKTSGTSTAQGQSDDQPPSSREDFFRDLKKVVKKLPPDHPSRSGSQKR